MEDAFIINGGKPLRGKVELSGAKNASYKLIIAALLFNQEITIQHVPRISDVFELFNLIASLGGSAKFIDKDIVLIDGRNITCNKVDFLFASKIRGSFMLFAALLYKFKEAYIPNPGGCRLGARSIDRIVDGMKQLGIQVEYDSSTGYYAAKMIQYPSGSYRFPKSSHTGTELLIMMSVLSDGNAITLENVAQEPEIDDLIRFLNEAGANISRNTDTLVIKGTKELYREKPFFVSADRIEAVTYSVLGIATRGEVTVGPIKENFISSFLDKLKLSGAGIEKLENDWWKFFYKGPLKGVDIETAPHPGFLTDWQPIYAVLMTQAQGDTIIHERIFENRFSYVEELKKLGADIEFIDIKVEDPTEFYHFNFEPDKKYTQAIRIRGPQVLHNGALKVSDIRAGATLAIAALVAEGESVINEVSHLERGYENFVQKVQKLGGDIKKV